MSSVKPISRIGAADHLGLAHIQRRDPFDELRLVGVDLHDPRLLGACVEAATRRSCRGTANLILVLEAHATAHSTAPGARLFNGLDRPRAHDVNGWPRTIFTPHRRSPTGEVQDHWWG